MVLWGGGDGCRPVNVRVSLWRLENELKYFERFSPTKERAAKGFIDGIALNAHTTHHACTAQHFGLKCVDARGYCAHHGALIAFSARK